MRPYVWIVEMWSPLTKRWEATVGASLRRTDAANERQRWKANNPTDKFRLMIYRQAAGSGR